MADLRLYEENLDRLRRTLRFEKTDRSPVMPCASSFCARAVGISLGDYCAAGPGTSDIHLKCWRSFDTLIDGVHGVQFAPEGLSVRWLSKVKIPGIDLPADELWQVDERELMTVEDYQDIIDHGYFQWEDRFIRERLSEPRTKLAPMAEGWPESLRKHTEAGLVDLGSATLAIPFESFCGARSMNAFMMDLIRRPKLIKTALDAAFPEILAADRERLRRMKPVAVWIGGWRTASNILSRKIWEEMVWPHFKRAAEMVIEEGIIPLYHLDSNWDRDLPRFRELPPHKGIVALDGDTDILKAQKVLENHTAVLGDVPPAMMAFSEPGEVRGYVENLIKAFGGRGYIAGVGCDAPPNTRRENMAALIEAAHGKRSGR